MPSISCIVPTLNEESCLAATLRSILVQRSIEEVIVADGGSLDATVEIANGFEKCQVATSAAGRGVQLNTGAALARGDLLLFLHADTLLPPEASEEIIRLLYRDRNLAGSFSLQFPARTPLLRFYAACSKINHPLFTYGDQGLFIRKNDFLNTGGFAALPFLEDIEFQRRIRKLGSFAKSRKAVTTSERRFSKVGPIRQQARNIAIVSAYLAGISPHVLAKRYTHIR